MKTLTSQSEEQVMAAIPRFSYAYDISMVDPLKALGIKKAFDENASDLSGIGNPASAGGGRLFISDVLHKTFIDVDEKGTKAAAVTEVGIAAGISAPMYKTVTLDRPFLYMIIYDETSLPVFIGVLAEIPKG
jgi:serpin B